MALTSELSRQRVGADLGIGKSTLGKWLSQYRPTHLVSTLQAESACENERPSLHNRVLREARKVLNAPHSSWRAKGREVRARAWLAALFTNASSGGSCHLLLYQRLP